MVSNPGKLFDYPPRQKNFVSKPSAPKVTFGTLSDVFLPSSGYCLDLGSANGPHRKEIEAFGYDWIGLDVRKFPQLTIQGDALHLPLARHTFSGVVLWQVLEHIPQPWTALAEVHRVLKPDGQVFGSVSFLEPYHDFSFFGFSELGLHQVLLDCGFEKIEIFPGISCFPLIVWTLFSRMFGGRLAGIAFKGMGTVIKMFNWSYSAIRWLYLLSTSQSSGELSESYWMSRVSYEFAGHLTFRAHKPSG